MDEGKIGNRYAKALFLLGEEKQMLDILYADMIYVAEVLRNIPDFSFLMDNPVLKLSDKKKIISAAFASSVNSITMQFLDLVTDQKRESFLDDIVRCFIDLYKKVKNIRLAVLTTAVTVTDDTVMRIRKVLSQSLNAEIEMSSEVNPLIIGGFVLRVDDLQYDSSIAAHLQRIKKEMQNSNL